jgi:hypothetical protein
MPPAEGAGDPEATRAENVRSGKVVDTADGLERGREAYARREWLNAYELLSGADQAVMLQAEDLELLATSASMLGRADDYVSVLERAHQVHLDAGEALRAARCAFWVGTHLVIRGEMGRATGWLGRAQRLRTGKVRFIVCGESSPRPTRHTGTRAGAAGSHSRASRCCGWLKAILTPPPARSVDSRARPPSG